MIVPTRFAVQPSTKTSSMLLVVPKFWVQFDWSCGGTGVAARLAAVVLPQRSPVGVVFVPPAFGKLVRLGSRFSLARCPGGAPVDAVGLVAGLAIGSWSLTLARSSSDVP